VTAAEAGARVAVLDAGVRPGGQYYRRPPRGTQIRLGTPPQHTWRPFDDLEQRLATQVDNGRVRILQDTVAWAAETSAQETSGTAFVVRTRGGDRRLDESLGLLRARSVIVATGAYDRHLPFPGWDLPGVLSGGAAQALVKGSLTRPGRSAVIAGTGPFLLAVAATLIEARVRVVAVIEAHDPLSPSLLRHVPALLGGAGKSAELARFVRLLARHRVPYLRGHRVIEASGVETVEAVTICRVDDQWRPVAGTERRLECDTVAVGFGFTAQTELPLQLGCEVRVGDDGGLAVRVDTEQRASVEGVFAAGETTGVGGADLALAEGIVAGAAAARGLGLQARPSTRGSGKYRLDVVRRRVRRLRRFAAGLHAAFPLRPGWSDGLPDSTIVCRCEEVDAGSIRNAVTELGADDPRTVKLLTRAGMGWCQGRVCGFAVDGLCGTTGSATGIAAADRLAAAARRPLTVPISLGALADLDTAGTEEAAE
jgi:NADPH-dependent 2,4-dienoyl-CoA reductase/sulfur reductase-like enzyme